jgi:polysaccharide biosynthesis protein PslH
MKILLLTNKSPWPPKDGGASATLSMIKGLIDCNASITVLSLNTSKHPVRIEDIPGELLRSTDYDLVNINSGINNVRLCLNLIFSRKPYNIERFWSGKYNSELIKVLKRNFDIVQIEGLSMHLYLNTVRQNSSAPVVFRPHNIENLIWARLADEEQNPFKRYYFRILAKRLRKIEKDIANKFDALQPISYPDLAWFETEGLSKPSLLSMPGYNPAEIIDNNALNTANVCFIGALDWLPNINGLNWFIREVWPLVTDRIPESKFFIAGRNASKKTITGLKGKKIVFVGEVESSASFINNKAVMVVPLFSGSGIRMKIIEGMSLGKCIVSTPVGAEGLLYEDKKDIFIASEASGFSEHIIELLTNPVLRGETAKNAGNNVRKNYNILVSSEKIMNFYRELTG